MSISNLLTNNDLDLKCNSLSTQKVLVTETNITNVNQLTTKAYVDAQASGTGDLQAVLQAGDDARDEQIVGLSNLETGTLATTGNVTMGGTLGVSEKVTSNILEAETLQLGTVENYNGIIKPVEGRILVFESSSTGGHFHYTGKNSFTAGITTRWDSNGERGSVLYRADNGVQGLIVSYDGINIYDYSNQDIKYNISVSSTNFELNHVDDTTETNMITANENNMDIKVDVDMNSNTISNVTDPTNAQDVATKNYVDSIPSVTPNLSSVLSLGNDANNTKIINVTDPTNAQDVATKNYVDSIPTTPITYDKNVFRENSTTIDILKTDSIPFNYNLMCIAQGDSGGLPVSASYTLRISKEWTDHDFDINLKAIGNTYIGQNATCTITLETYTDDTFTTPESLIYIPGTSNPNRLKNSYTITSDGYSPLLWSSSKIAVKTQYMPGAVGNIGWLCIVQVPQ